MGYASPSKMLAEMSGQELMMWRAYYSNKADDRRDEELEARNIRNLNKRS